MISATRKTVLIICSNPESQSCLRGIVEQEGFRAVVANNGIDGMAKYHQELPDVVLLEYRLGDMSALEACKELKTLSNERFVPTIIISNHLNDYHITECIKAGADDIVFTPFSTAIIRTRIYAMFRVGDLYDNLFKLNSQKQRDEELAQQLFGGVVEKDNVAKQQIKIFKRSAANFSGDVQLTALRPNGDINILFGDFNGHGLGATIGVIPLADTFRAMTKKGYGSLDIIKQINLKMCSLLPTQMFLALSMISLSVSERIAYVWNAGIENVLIFDPNSGQLKHKIPSFHPPLGIFPNLNEGLQPEMIALGPQDRIVIYSDGIVEARNRSGECFGEQRLIDATRLGFEDDNIQRHVIAALETFCEGVPPDGDVSLLDINCDIELYDVLAPDEGNGLDTTDDIEHIDNQGDSTDQWTWQMSLVGNKLATLNPVPLIMSQVQELEGEGEHWHTLYTVLTELYVNALEHGVLRLQSKLKSSPRCFSQYFDKKQQRLGEVDEGSYIKIHLHHRALENGGVLSISISDSGEGFEFSPWIGDDDESKQLVNLETKANQFSGRGIKLVRHLCQDLRYLDNGRIAKASYVWNKVDAN